MAQPEFTGADPQLALELVPNLCSYGLRPHVITGFLVQVFRQHFADRTNIEEPSLRDSLWKIQDPTGIVVESITRWDSNKANRRPAIVVKRGPASFLRLGIGDLCMGWIHESGFDYYLSFMTGSHTLFCIGNEAGEAERLAAEVYREIVQFGPVLRHYLGLHRFVLAEVGQLYRLPEATDGYAVPVSVAYAYEEFWRLEPHVPVLRRFTLGTTLEASL
jgi:hypothetical protein